jgi:hypothetical protein
VAAPQGDGLSHLRPWRKGESGNPHGRAVRAIKLFELMAPDFGELSAVESAVLLQACRLMARGERAANPNNAVRLSNAAVRLLTTLRRKRSRPDRPPLRERLAAEFADQGDAV